MNVKIIDRSEIRPGKTGRGVSKYKYLLDAAMNISSNQAVDIEDVRPCARMGVRQAIKVKGLSSILQVISAGNKHFIINKKSTSVSQACRDQYPPLYIPSTRSSSVVRANNIKQLKEK